MSNFSCNCSCNRGSICPLISIAVSVIVGIITTLLTITATITVTPAFLWVLLGIAVVYLAVNLIATSLFGCRRRCRCIGTPLSLVLIGILFTILLAIILLGIEFAATSVLGAIITGLLLLFFTLFITSTACLIRCFAGVESSNDDFCE